LAAQRPGGVPSTPQPFTTEPWPANFGIRDGLPSAKKSPFHSGLKLFFLGKGECPFPWARDPPWEAAGHVKSFSSPNLLATSLWLIRNFCDVGRELSLTSRCLPPKKPFFPFRWVWDFANVFGPCCELPFFSPWHGVGSLFLV